jgi:hypothetical protein
MEEWQLEHTWAMEAFRCFIWGEFEGSVTLQWKYVPFYPLVHAVHMEESYENLKGFPQKIRYEEHLRNILADKVVAMRMVKLGGYTVFLFLVWIRQPSDGLQLHNKKRIHSVQNHHQVRGVWCILL